MANPKKTKKTASADPKEALGETIAKRKAVLAKHAGKAGNDAKRRLALKKLKRAQRGLGKIRTAEKRVAEKAKKGEATA